MYAYILRRLVILIPTLLLTTLIVFFTIHLIPGDFIDAVMAQSIDQAVDRSELELKYGLDAPLIVQYARWMGFAPQKDGKFAGIIQGDFGISWWTHAPVLTAVARKWPVSFELGLMALVIGQLVALPIGILSALRQDSWKDYLGRTLAILFISVPAFWLGTRIIVYPSIWWRYMPSIFLIRFVEDPLGNLKMFIVPAIVLGMGMAGATMRMTRTMMLEVMRQDYIRTAWAKGLRERTITRRHALRNALIPVVTIIGLQAPILIGGTVIIEDIFVLPGMGRLVIEATFRRDQQLLSGVVLLFALALMLINLVVDLSYAALDPRIRYK
jgi:peptide/nickel transport system permease protein